MYRKSIDFSITFNVIFIGLVCTFLSAGKPLNSEDVASLLPATPKTINDTLAAIVQDSIVKDAVQYAVGNGTLSGLVVKKNVVVLSATAPDTVLSHTEQTLTVPPMHLEDVRRNITEEVQTEVDDKFQSTQSSFLNYWTSQNDYIEIERESDSSTSLQENVDPMQNFSLNNTDIKEEVPLPEGVVMERLQLPPVIQDKVSVPVVAVLNSSKSVNDKIESSIVALLPSNAETTSLKNQLEFLENNHDQITEEVQRSLLAQQPKFSVYWGDDTNYLDEPNDLDIAEDIVFRPLFRYRQEAQHRTSYDNYRRSNYRRYGSYDQYNNYDSYRKPYRYKPRYYSNYD